MAFTDREYEIQSDRRMMDGHQKHGRSRSIWTRGRTIESTIHGPQLFVPLENRFDLRDEATGRMLYVEGYSRTYDDGDEGDLVPDE